MVMNWWQKMIIPVRRVFLSLSVSARAKTPDHGGGLLKLHDDIQTCGYEDIRVMWEMLSGSDSSELTSQQPKQKQRLAERVN